MVRTLLVLLLCALPLRASIFEILGGQKVGTTSFVFLKIGVGARASGLGECFVSVADDASTLYWNPAGAAVIEERQASFVHTDWFLDIVYDYASLIYPMGRLGTVGIQLAALQSGYMEETDEYHPFGTGEYFCFRDVMGALTYSKAITDRFSFGLSFKLITETLADLDSYGGALDIGTLYLVGYRDIRIGASLSNLGPDVRPRGTYLNANGNETSYEAFPLPIVYRMGVSGMLARNLRIAFQIDKPSDNVEIFRMGLEYRPFDVLSFRAGYKLNARSVHDGGLPSDLSLGAGLSVPVMSYRINVDYAYTGMGFVGDVQRLSLGVGF
jgi:hypothetical protein